MPIQHIIYRARQPLTRPLFCSSTRVAACTINDNGKVNPQSVIIPHIASSTFCIHAFSSLFVFYWHNPDARFVVIKAV